MKTSKYLVLVPPMWMGMVGLAFADVTGDFKLVGAIYDGPGDDTGGNAIISGTVNYGAIQSKKSVVVEFAYTIAYNYTVDETMTIHEPGACTDLTYYNAHKNGCDHADKGHSALWIGTTTTTTVTKSFNGTDGMTAITKPTLTNGRLNPKGKITGYNWSKAMSFVPIEIFNAQVIAGQIILPTGATLGDVAMVNISYRAYLVDASGAQIPDTVVSGACYRRG